MVEEYNDTRLLLPPHDGPYGLPPFFGWRSRRRKREWREVGSLAGNRRESNRAFAGLASACVRVEMLDVRQTDFELTFPL